jgi:AcrR family transcriptional regulator
MTVQTSRRRGRPQASASLRSQLLQVVCDQLAVSGSTGFTFRQIAGQAGVTSALVHYYFTDRDGLLDAVARECAQPLIDAVTGMVRAKSANPIVALTCFVQQYTAVAMRHRWLPLFTAQYVGRGPNPCLPLTDLLMQLVERAQAGGQLRHDLPAGYVVLSLLSQCAFPFVAQATHTHHVGVSLDSSAAAQLTLQHLALLQAGVATTRATTPRRNRT